MNKMKEIPEQKRFEYMNDSNKTWLKQQNSIFNQTFEQNTKMEED
jgi:hypothetical protein